MQTHIDLAFADGVYTFRLGLAQLHELQEKCGVGIGGLYARVLQGRGLEDIELAHPGGAAYYVNDLVETVRQGLIGGGAGIVNGADVTVNSLRANDLVDRYLLPLPLMEQWRLAAAILFAKVEGFSGGDTAPAGEVDPADDEKKKTGMV